MFLRSMVMIEIVMLGITLDYPFEKYIAQLFRAIKFESCIHFIEVLKSTAIVSSVSQKRII